MEKAHQWENIFTWETHVGFLFSFVSVLLIFFFFLLAHISTEQNMLFIKMHDILSQRDLTDWKKGSVMDLQWWILKLHSVDFKSSYFQDSMQNWYKK